MKKILYAAGVFVVAIVLFFSCTNENSVVTPVSSDINKALRVGTDNERIKELLDKTALAVAKAVQKQSLRDAIKAKAMLKADGDFDVFYGSFSKEKTKDGKTVHEELKAFGVTDNILSSLPTFQLSVPVNCEDWNTKEHTPLVAFVSPDDDEKGLIKAYDKDGKVHLLSATEEPKEPVIVVSLSERFDESGKSKYKPNNTKGARTANSMEYMEGFAFGDHLGDFESWARGGPEVFLTIAGVRNGAVVNPIWRGTGWYPNRNQCSGGWWYVPDTFTFTWTEDYGMYLSYVWIEEDEGDIESIPISVSWAPVTGGGNITQFSTTIPKHNNDDELGVYTIYRNEPSHDIAYGSAFQFRVRF
ncbi:DUF3103 family protein [Spirosoma areae]